MTGSKPKPEDVLAVWGAGAPLDVVAGMESALGYECPDVTSLWRSSDLTIGLNTHGQSAKPVEPGEVRTLTWVSDHPVEVVAMIAMGAIEHKRRKARYCVGLLRGGSDHEVRPIQHDLEPVYTRGIVPIGHTLALWNLSKTPMHLYVVLWACRKESAA